MSAEPTNRSTPRNILLADDGSEHARAAARLICELPLPPDSRVTVMSVLPAVKAGQKTPVSQIEPLPYCQTSLGERGVAVNSQQRWGHPAEELTNFADSDHSDLIVLGAQGLRATLGILLGGVAQQVVEYAHWPVLVVRAPYKGLLRILIAVDGSTHSQRALEFTASFPFPSSAEIHLIHVLPPIPSEVINQTWSAGPDVILPVPTSPLNIEKLKEEEEKAGKELLAANQESLAAAGLGCTTALRRGDAASEIIRYIKERSIDLVISGSRGLSQVRGWLLGSVSRKLVHYANCSALIVK